MIVEMIKAGVQIIIMTSLFYYIYTSLAQNKVTKLITRVLIFIALYVIASAFKLNVAVRLFRLAALPYSVFLFVLYQPELRRAFAPGFVRRNRFFGHSQFTTSDDLDDIISACQQLVQCKRGALIVFPRNVSIKNVIDSGTRLDADISQSLIRTVFEHDTPLHDGAMIIQRDKIVSAGCYLPLSEQMDINASFGTRHRAALGIAEESDAVVIVVSEESGAISLAYNGNLYYQLEPESIKATILALFSGLDTVQEISGEEINETK